MHFCREGFGGSASSDYVPIPAVPYANKRGRPPKKAAAPAKKRAAPAKKARTAKPAPAAEPPAKAEERAAPAKQAPAKAARGVKRGAPKGTPRRGGGGAVQRRGAAAQQHKRALETYKARFWRVALLWLPFVAQAHTED